MEAKPKPVRCKSKVSPPPPPVMDKFYSIGANIFIGKTPTALANPYQWITNAKSPFGIFNHYGVIDPNIVTILNPEKEPELLHELLWGIPPNEKEPYLTKPLSKLGLMFVHGKADTVSYKNKFVASPLKVKSGIFSTVTPNLKFNSIHSYTGGNAQFADCGAWVLKRNYINPIHVATFDTYFKLAVLHYAESILVNGSFLTWSEGTSCNQYIHGILQDIAAYSGVKLPLNNHFGPHTDVPLQPVGTATEMPSLRKHYLWVITLDSMRRFYESEEFAKLKLTNVSEALVF